MVLAEGLTDEGQFAQQLVDVFGRLHVCPVLERFETVKQGLVFKVEGQYPGCGDNALEEPCHT
ncbi:hypothetical protein GCM10008955_29500 [Deinococcus malanensis]|uniref:Uncharacterized protein n=1 Tax=Deinococcus malanensis TaxID=1706855 RepID=A0ABQ2EYR1_9DEIO|nr:hypothetical protein GCM10008955_29500 [Deinococcus malanensis]